MRETTSIPLRKTVLAALIAGLATAPAAMAEQQAQADQSSKQQAEPQQDLARVVVTANRREQYLQDVPLAVTAVSGVALERANIREATDLQYVAPGVSFSSTNPVSNGGGFQVRGVGTQTYDSGVEQTVGLVVDGVVIGMSRDPGATGFSDIDRIEVLRGPQGTLFGKNSSAGVIQIITKQPRIGQNSGEMSLSLGQRNEQVAKAAINLGLGDATAVRISGYSQKQDGAIPYVARSGGHVGDRNNKGIRAKLLWQATEDFSVLLNAEHQEGFARDAQTIESLGTSALYNSQFNKFEVKPGHGVYASYQDGDWTADTKLDGASATLEYQLGDYRLTSISAWRKLKTSQITDVDAAPVDIFNHSDGGVDSKQVTQEFRLTSPAGEKLEYVLGAFFYKTDNFGSVVQYGKYYGAYPVPLVVGGGIRNQSNETRSSALFGQGTYAINDQLKLITGLRYTKDKVSGKGELVKLPFATAPIGTFLPYNGEVDADNVSGRVGLQYQLNKDAMVYSTYSRGYKGPAIDGTSGTPHEVKPETVNSYELGARTTLLGGDLTLNGTIYSSDFKNFQAQTLDLTTSPPVFGLSNAGLMRSRGVELETSLRVTRQFDLTASATYNDAQFKDYIGTCYPGQPVSGTVGVGCYLDPVAKQNVANNAGQRLPNAPKWSYNLRGLYRYTLDNGWVADASANWAWRSEAQTITADPKSVVSAYGLLNLNIGLGKRDGAWRVSLYGRNVLDKQFYAPYPAGTLNPGGYSRIMSPEAFRTIGANLSLKF